MVDGRDKVTTNPPATVSVEIPEDVLYALKEKPGALEAFQALPAAQQQEILDTITTANMSDIREGRINRLVEKLTK
jgi:uncharacterized protein YdeI (YjbR/CyaY-like superfamily)